MPRWCPGRAARAEDTQQTSHQGLRNNAQTGKTRAVTGPDKHQGTWTLTQHSAHQAWPSTEAGLECCLSVED